jgi:hypothetical protein
LRLSLTTRRFVLARRTLSPRRRERKKERKKKRGRRGGKRNW